MSQFAGRRADAGEEIGDGLLLAEGVEDEAAQHLFAHARGLQEAAGRGNEIGRADPHHRRAALDDHVAMHREPGEVERVGEARECRALLRRGRAVAADVRVDAAGGGGELDVERLAGAGESLGHRPGDRQGGGKRGHEQRTRVDRHDVVRTRRHEAHFDAARAGAGVQRHATAARAMRGDEWFDLGRHAGLPQRGDDQIALPAGIEGRCHVLRRAAAAAADERAGGGDAVGRRSFN